jgi:hypothetical protein
MLKRKSLIEDINKRLSILKYNIEMQNKSGYFDINKFCEDFLKELLNIIYDLEFKNLNHSYYNHPAIDLGDLKNKICIQVTSTNARKKIEYTIEKFESNTLYNNYSTLGIFILGQMKQYKKFDINGKYLFYINDINSLFLTISELEDIKLEQVSKYLKDNIILREDSEDKNLFEEFNLKEKQFIIFLSEHDFAIEPTHIEVIDKIKEIYYEWGLGDKRFVNKLFNNNIEKILSALLRIKEYLESGKYFRIHTSYSIAPIKSPSRVEFNEVLKETYEYRKIIIGSYQDMIRIYNELYK